MTLRPSCSVTRAVSRQGWQPVRGEDPLAGLQRSLQPGPQGDAHVFLGQRRTTADIFSETCRGAPSMAFITGIKLLNREA